MLLRLNSFRFRLINLVNSFMMETPKTVADLEERSRKADEMIRSLKNQIEQIKLQSTPEYIAKRKDELKTENEKLKAKIQEKLKELEQAEAAKAQKQKAKVEEKPKQEVKQETGNEKKKEAKPKTDVPASKKDSKEPPSIYSLI